MLRARYDAAHLAAHPAQKIASVRLVYSPGDEIAEAFLEFRLRNRAGRYKLFGACKPSGPGLVCRPGWDAGSWRIERGPNGTIDVVNHDMLLNPANFDAEEVAPGAVTLRATPEDGRWRLKRRRVGAACRID